MDELRPSMSESLPLIQPALSTGTYITTIAKKEIPNSILRTLADSSYNKRKAAAQELQNKASLLVESQNYLQVQQYIQFFAQDYISNQAENLKQGGLMAFSAIAIAVGSKHEATSLCQMMLQPVINCFRDHNHRVRYFAIECLYNIVKVSRQQVLSKFNDIFRSMIEVFADVDSDVRRAAVQLDNLLKGVIVETEADPAFFNQSLFMETICELLRAVRNPSVQQMLVSWLLVLDSIPSFDILEYLPNFLEGLFRMLTSPNKDVKQCVFNCLKDFLEEVKEAIEQINVDSDKLLACLARLSQDEDSFVKSVSVDWISTIIMAARFEITSMYAVVLRVALSCMSDRESVIVECAENINHFLLKNIEILCTVSSIIPPSPLKYTVSQLLSQPQAPLISVMSTPDQSFVSLYDATGSKDSTPPPPLDSSEIITPSHRVGTLAKESADGVHTRVDFVSIVGTLMEFINSTSGKTREAVLDWIVKLHNYSTESIQPTLYEILDALISRLADPSNTIIDKTLSVLSVISSYEEYFDIVIISVLRLFQEHAELIEQNCNLILKELCKHLGTERIYSKISTHLETNEDKYFVMRLVEVMNSLLLIDHDLEDVREKLKLSLETQDRTIASFFETIFRVWCYNPVSTVTLCLLVQAYELAYQILQHV
jgi:vacuole morphology and inheritance protein 14